MTCGRAIENRGVLSWKQLGGKCALVGKTWVFRQWVHVFVCLSLCVCVWVGGCGMGVFVCMSGCPASYFFLLFRISPSFSYFSTKFLLFPTFWLWKAKFLPTFFDFLKFLQFFCDFVSKICNFLVNLIDFGKSSFNFEKI